ncbi:hypothetical protein [Rhodococcus opacus]|nr:hypothetical protein [Rhodococcus opacus]UNN00744.1 hypothetical protein MOO23_34880 [Rhodococcus opacus]
MPRIEGSYDNGNGKKHVSLNADVVWNKKSRTPILRIKVPTRRRGR